MSRLAPTVRPGAAIARIKTDRRVSRLLAAFDARHPSEPHVALTLARGYDEDSWQELARDARAVPGPRTRALLIEELEARASESRRGLLR